MEMKVKEPDMLSNPSMIMEPMMADIKPNYHNDHPRTVAHKANIQRGKYFSTKLFFLFLKYLTPLFVRYATLSYGKHDEDCFTLSC